MIPTRYDYYRACAREHRLLAQGAPNEDQRLMHDRLVGAYTHLARKYALRQRVSLRV
ncbi:MAG: hypothetical protein R3E09_00680 [Novosphingobium sp.]|nr:hypothetical protein [Novosphingobium sp.]